MLEPIELLSDIVDGVTVDVYHRPDRTAVINDLDDATFERFYRRPTDRVAAIAAEHGLWFGVPEWGVGGTEVNGLSFMARFADYLSSVPNLRYHTYFAPSGAKPHRCMPTGKEPRYYRLEAKDGAVEAYRAWMVEGEKPDISWADRFDIHHGPGCGSNERNPEAP